MTSHSPIGFPLFPAPDLEGRLSYPLDLDQSVRQMIRVILTTRPGELLLHPDFGAGLDRYLNQPNSVSLRRDVHDRIVESLGKWEPRISVDRIDVGESEDDPAVLVVQIAYHLRRTGAARTLGLTLLPGAH